MILETYEPEAEHLIDPASELERLAGGFQFTEGPVWDRFNRRLYFSDIPADTLYTYSVTDGVQVFRKPSNYANGLVLDNAWCLVACEHGTRRVTRTGTRGVQVVADRYKGRRLNSPNDVIVARDGSLIFTDPHYGLLEGLGGPGVQELPFRGVYRVAAGADEPTLLVDDFDAPNGLALSPDGKTLYVDDTIRGHIRAFDVRDDWSVSGGDVFLTLRGDDPGAPDGMTLDAAGNVYCTGPGGVWICSPDGLVLGRIPMPEVTANLNWGDDDGGSLYITASTSLYRLRCLPTAVVKS